MSGRVGGWVDGRGCGCGCGCVCVCVCVNPQPRGLPACCRHIDTVHFSSDAVVLLSNTFHLTQSHVSEGEREKEGGREREREREREGSAATQCNTLQYTATHNVAPDRI